MAVAQNILARTFKSLHKSGKPIILVNVYDAPSANAVASLPTAKVIATASYAIAQAAGIEDDDLTYEMNLAATRPIAFVAKKYNKPVSVDLQDGYGELLEEAVAAFLQIGIVGINLEDCNKSTHNMYSVVEAVARIKKALTVAKSHGVPDFVVNARCDTLVHGGSISKSIARGQAYLAAGAATVFIWGGSARGGVSRDEIVQLIKEFDGRINVSKKLSVDGLTIHELAEMGVARISIGPALQFVAMAKFKKEADKLLQEQLNLPYVEHLLSTNIRLQMPPSYGQLLSIITLISKFLMIFTILLFLRKFHSIFKAISIPSDMRNPHNGSERLICMVSISCLNEYFQVGSDQNIKSVEYLVTLNSTYFSRLPNGRIQILSWLMELHPDI